MNADDLAAMGERHVAVEGINLEYVWCAYCGSRFHWPCDSRRLLDEVEALRSQLAASEAGSEVFTDLMDGNEP